MTTAGTPPVVVALHAHPDDESLLTGGTLAGIARRGGRVVLVVATDGARGLTGSGSVDVAGDRRLEVRRAAAALGIARVVELGYRDSGDAGAAPGGFCRVPVDEIAERVATIVRRERADLLIGYDRVGGYGHPDHRHVHAVAAATAASTGVRLLHATIDRTWINRAVWLLARFRVLPAGFDPGVADGWYSPRSAITHRVRVFRTSRAKRAALRCHASQTTGGDAVRTIRLLLRLPRPVFAVVTGTEWFVEAGAAPVDRPLRDPLVAAGRAAA